MKNLKMMSHLFVVAGLVALTTAPIIAHAGQVTVAGTASGVFSTGTPGDLTYTAPTNGFSATTVNGGATLGNGDIANSSSLGIFTLQTPASGSDTYDGHNFTLNLTFTQPVVISGSNTLSNIASLTGSIDSLGNGGVNINFDQTPISFTFANSTDTGEFTFRMQQVSIQPSRDGVTASTVALSAVITGASSSSISSVPEPSSVAAFAFMGIGMMGLMLFARKRRSTMTA